jgi:hypothetical protein
VITLALTVGGAIAALAVVGAGVVEMASDHEDQR